jgi:hypothetical protein
VFTLVRSRARKLRTKMNRYLIAALPIALLAGAFPGSAETVTVNDNASISSPTGPGTTGGCYTGSGCDNTGFTQSTNGTTELDLNANIRFVSAVAPVGNVYTVPAGTAADGYALWDYGFSILTTPNGNGNTTLGSYTYLLTLTDANNPAGNIIFNPLAIPDDDWWGPGGRDAGGTLGGAASANIAAAVGAQNYENFAFPIIGTDGNVNVPDTYTVTLDEYSGTVLDNSDTITINSVAPEPGTFALAGMVLAGLGLARKKFRKA